MKSVDKNQDGLIDYKEHMDYMNSTEAINDEGWEVCASELQLDSLIYQSLT